jgi:hypothetical protein
MNRRIPLKVGAAVGGLLSAALLPAAVAFADDSFTLVPDGPEVITSASGYPPFYQETIGTAVFDANQGNPFMTLGEFNADVNTFTTSWGYENQEIVVTGGQVGGLTVPTGSIFDFVSFGGGFGNEYSDVIGIGPGGANAIADTFVTPFGDFNIATTFDAVALLEMPGAIIP